MREGEGDGGEEMREEGGYNLEVCSSYIFFFKKWESLFKK